MAILLDAFTIVPYHPPFGAPHHYLIVASAYHNHNFARCTSPVNNAFHNVGGIEPGSILDTPACPVIPIGHHIAS